MSLVILVHHADRAEPVTHLDEEEAVVIAPPVPPHPVLAVTAGPVDVLAVGKVPPIQVVLHLLLDPDDLPGALGPSVLKQTDQVGVNGVLEVVVGVGGYLVLVALAEYLLSVPEVNGPETVVAPDFSESEED